MDKPLNMGGAVLINPNPANQKIEIGISAGQNGQPAYELQLGGFIAPDQAMITHEVIFHLSNVIRDLNTQLATAHNAMLQHLAQQAAARETLQRN